MINNPPPRKEIVEYMSVRLKEGAGPSALRWELASLVEDYISIREFAALLAEAKTISP